MQSKYVITKWYICSPDLLEAKKHFVWCLFFTVFLEKKLHSHSWPFMLHSTNCKANLMCNSLAWISLSLCSLLLFLIKFYAWHSFMAYSRRQKINKSKLTKNTPKKKKLQRISLRVFRWRMDPQLSSRSFVLLWHLEEPEKSCNWHTLPHSREEIF